MNEMNLCLLMMDLPFKLILYVFFDEMRYLQEISSKIR